MKVLARLHVLLQARERGQTMAEYAVVLGVITLAPLPVFTLLGNNVGPPISAISPPS